MILLWKGTCAPVVPLLQGRSPASLVGLNWFIKPCHQLRRKHVVTSTMTLFYCWASQTVALACSWDDPHRSQAFQYWSCGWKFVKSS